jgi:hypothetical protein
MMSRLCGYELPHCAVRSHSSFTRWFYRTHARSSVSPLLSLPPGRLYAPLNFDVLRAHRRTPYTHGDARRTSALAVYCDNGTSSALPAAVSSALFSPRLIGLAERTVSSMSLFPSTMSRVFSPCLSYVLPALPTVHDRCPLSFLLPHSLSILRLLANFPISSSGRMSFQHSNMSISGYWDDSCWLSDDRPPRLVHLMDSRALSSPPSPVIHGWRRFSFR